MKVLVLVLILGAALFLRAWRIEAAPFHADEAVQAAIFQDFVKGEYRYDPHHYHGPLPHYLNRIWLKGADLNEWQFRVVPVMVGTLLVLAVALSLWREDRKAALIGAVLAASSPMLVFFSRFGLHESLFVLSGFLATWAVAVFFQKPGVVTAVVAGVVTAVVAAGKETVVLFVAGWVVAGLSGGWFKLRTFRYAPAGLLAFVVALLLLFGGTGFVDFWRSYFVYQTDPGHQKPFWYFLWVLAPSARWSGEPWFWLGLIALAFRPKPMPVTVRFMGLSGLLSLLFFSLIPYKTPWLLMLPLALCLPAAGWIFGQSKWPVQAALGALVLWQTSCAWRVSQKEFWDSRIPLVYSPSSYQMPAFRAYLQKANGDRPIAVIGTNYWPLPWYLRGFTKVGYFEEIPAELPPGYATYLLCDEAMEKSGPAGEERLWGVRTDYLMKSLVISPGGPDKPK